MPFFNNYDPSSFGWTANTGIVPFVYRGVNFYNGVHAKTVLLFQALIDDLVTSGAIPSPFNQADGYWGYENREIRNGTTTSFHAYGTAIDIDAVHNGFSSAGVLDTVFDVGKCNAIARKYLCEWGGGWTSPKDPMHFEVHGSPDEVDQLVAGLGGQQSDLESWMASNEDAVKAIVQSVVNDAVSKINANLHKELSTDSIIGSAAFGPNFRNAVKDSAGGAINDNLAKIAGAVGKQLPAQTPVDASGVAGAVQASLAPVLTAQQTAVLAGVAKMLDAFYTRLESSFVAGQLASAPDLGAAIAAVGQSATDLGKKLQ